MTVSQLRLSFQDPFAPERLAAFWAKVEKTDGCWLWTGARNPGRWAHGRFWFRNGTSTQAHRYAYQACVGPIPDGMFVCHHCDNPPCVRPDHLYVGTAQDNIDDMWRRGRARPHYGVKGHTTLNWDSVGAIRALYASGVTRAALARKFSVDWDTINEVVSGRTWAA